MTGSARQGLIPFDEVAKFLAQLLAGAHCSNDPSGILVPSSRPVRRLGLALEPFPGFGGWLEREALDALFLHRPWRLGSAELPAGVGVLAYHLAFDERLTIGMNPWLAARLGLSSLEPLGRKEGRVIGMVGEGTPRSFAAFADEVNALFEGSEDVVFARRKEVRRVAVVGAMNAALVEAASARGADVYLTGQLRPSALGAVGASGLGVLAVGHARSERWGLMLLATLLQEALPGLEVVLAP